MNAPSMIFLSMRDGVLESPGESDVEDDECSTVGCPTKLSGGALWRNATEFGVYSARVKYFASTERLRGRQRYAQAGARVLQARSHRLGARGGLGHGGSGRRRRQPEDLEQE